MYVCMYVCMYVNQFLLCMNKIKLCQSQFTDNKVCACSSLFSASYNDLQLPDISATTFIQCLEFVNPFTTVHE